MENEGRTEPVAAADAIKLGDVDGVSCSTCFYWHQKWLSEKPTGVGRCLRRPPIVLFDEVMQPETKCSDTCGDWHTDTEPPQSMGLCEIA